MEVQFVDGVISRLEYEKAVALTADDMLAILTTNGGAAAWTKTAADGWIRRDGATATLDRTTGRRLRLLAPPPTAVAAPNATVPLIAPPKPFQYVNPQAVAAKPKPPNNHFWLMALSWVPLLLMALFGKYALKRQAKVRVFGPSDVIYPSSTTPVTPAVPATIDSVSWDQFELVIAELYRRQGYAVEVSSGLGADGGIDVKLTKAGELVLVQCKQWQVFKVNVKEVRAFFGVMVSEGAHRGLFASTGEYTRDCRAFANGKPIELLGRADLNRMVEAAQSPGENLWVLETWLPAFRAAVRITTPTCPFCHTTMTLRQAKGKVPFWGCPKYPRCRGKREARLELLSDRNY
jgi:HJR/Mrr/RecB family endonuclease